MSYAYELPASGKCDWCKVELGLRIFHFEGSDIAAAAA